MANDTLPVPQPVDTSAPLPAPEPIETAENLPPPTPVSSPAQGSSALPPPVDPSTQPISDNDHNLLSSFKDKILKPAEAMVTGPGTMLSKDNAGPTFEDWIKSPAAENWQKTKDAFHRTMNSSLIVPSNAITPEEAAANPHTAAAERGVSNAIRGLTTPGSIALIAGTEGMGELPAALERTLGASKELAPYAAKAAKVAKASLQGLGAYFTLSQITDAAKAVPEIAQAIMTGQTDKAIELTTGAFINGVVGTKAGIDTAKSIRGSVDEAAANSAMKHGDYADIVHDRQKTLQVAGGQKDQIADLGREVAPNVKDREWATEYVEANRDRKLLAKRQAETEAGPKPTDQIAATTQGEETPLAPEGTVVPVTKEPPTQEELSDPASQEALALKAALEDAKAASAAHVITPEERAAMVEQQDPTRDLSTKHGKAIDYVMDKMEMMKEAAQKVGLLPKGQLRNNFVPHEYDFDDTSDPTRRRLYNAYHDAQQAGLVPKNKDFFALTSDYIGKMWQKIADASTIQKLKSGRTNDGAPLAVPGGFVEGQRVSTEGAQPPALSTQDVQRLTKNGQLPKLIKSGDVLTDPTGKVFRFNPDHYEKASNLFESHAIGPTPIPPKVLDQIKPQLEEMEQRGLVYKNEKGEYFNTEPVYARTPVYLHKDIAEHFNSAVKPKTEEPTSFFGRAGKLYDDTTGNMKSLLLSWSPFHRVTESMRMMEGLGLTKGAKLAAQTNLGLAPKVDYFNLTPGQEAAIRDGIVTSDPRGRSMSNVEEGLSAGEGNTWGAKTYKLLDQTIGKLIESGAKKVGMSDATAAKIRNNINFQNILTKDVFGPQGMITQAKFALYADRKPAIAAQMAKDHPDWSSYEVDTQAGRQAAKFANNKFGGLNTVVLGRTLQDQKWLRRVLLAPDFLESTGRSVLDLGDKYGGELVSKLIQFNVAHALTAAGINYALHHNDEDNSIKGAVEATHILDHPYGVVGPDGKTVYGLRTTATDFLHMIDKPREFAYDRVNPMLRAADESIEQRNQYGRKESLPEALKSFPKATLPIQVQNLVGLGPNTTTEPSIGDQFLKSIGIQARPNRSNAEQLAIDKVSGKLLGQEARTGGALAKQQMRFNAEDKLRSAYQLQDPDKKKVAIEHAKHDIDSLLVRKVIDPETRKKILVDAKGSRLKSEFTHLGYNDALDVWDAATDEEKKELGVAMNAHYLRFREDLAKQRLNINELDGEHQETLNRFKEASGQLAEIRERPEPIPVKKSATKTQEKSSPGLDSLPAPEPYTGELPAPTPARTVIGDPANIPGMIKPGNINLDGRPTVKNADGTHSSEYSFSFGDDSGHEILVPTIVNGKFLTPDGKKPKEGSPEEKEMFKRAQQHYEQTGETLGVFDNPDHADAYANIVHNRPPDFISYVNDAAKKYGVQPDLIQAMIKQESLGDPNAVSRKGAKGLLQLEPLVAKHYGVTDPSDPEQNIEAGTHYIADLLKIYNGDEAKALAAFNAGPTAVNHYGGVPPFHETQKYVENIQNR